MQDGLTYRLTEARLKDSFQKWSKEGASGSRDARRLFCSNKILWSGGASEKAKQKTTIGVRRLSASMQRSGRGT